MLKRLGPGLLLAALGGAAGLVVHQVVPVISPTLVAIVLGLTAGLSGVVRDDARPGLQYTARTVLRVGVALLGLQLVFSDILALGWELILVVVAVVTIGIAGTLLLGRMLGISREQSLLVACGFSICGAAAVAAVEGVRHSRDRDVAVAISLVVLFGTTAMLGIPALGMLLGFDEVAAGAWSGAAIHEVGQVVVAGGLLGGAALQVAVAVKLGRVLMLAPVLAVLSVVSRSEARVEGKRPPLVPTFVVVFVALAGIRSAGLVPDVALDVAGFVQAGALAAAMFAIGSAIDPRAVRQINAKVLTLAAGATALVGVVALPAAFLA